MENRFQEIISFLQNETTGYESTELAIEYFENNRQEYFNQFGIDIINVFGLFMTLKMRGYEPQKINE